MTWVNDNRWLSGGVAVLLITVIAGFAILSSEDELTSKLADPGGPRSELRDNERSGAKGSQPGSDGDRTNAGVDVDATSVIPGLPGVPNTQACVPKKVDTPGVTDDSITIGQIVTDSNQLPQQLRPIHEGLEAFIKLFNATGGLCDRELKLEYRNDNLNPATHRADYAELASRVLAFVGNESLLDSLDYEQSPPFSPSQEVPDVGGLAFAYGRSQSLWHAGVIGSVSPVLIGGGQYRYFVNEAKAKGKPCRKGGVIYLQEPTGASEDQARLGQVSLEESWGANLGDGNTQLYAANLLDPVPAYEVLVDRMISDGMNCVFSYTDLQSSINLAQALGNRGVWPPDDCDRGNQCFRVVYVPLSAYDSKFIADAGEGGRMVSTFIPHAPLIETTTPAMRVYLDALEDASGARPSTFSILGFASGQMFVQALGPCAAAPTRSCLMKELRSMKDFTAGGLLGGTTPFRTTKATFDEYGSYDWKWIFNHSVAMRVLDRGGKRDFHRVRPDADFFKDTLHVARGTPG